MPDVGQQMTEVVGNVVIEQERHEFETTSFAPRSLSGTRMLAGASGRRYHSRPAMAFAKDSMSDKPSCR